MKTKVISIFIIVFSLTFAILPAFNPASAQAIPCPLVDCDLISIFNRITGLVRPVVIIALIGVIIYGGFTRMTAAGDPEKEKKSMQILTAGIVGFLIIVFAGFIVELLGNLLGTGDLITNVNTTPTP